MPQVALSIAGLDPDGGAGILADIKTFSIFGVHGVGVITAITYQNTKEFLGLYELPVDVVISQLRAILNDITVHAIKISTVYSPEIITALANELRKVANEIPIIIDPVIYTKTGGKLLRDDAIEVFKKELIPLARVITPNAIEASILTGIKVENLENAMLAARKLHDMGAETVVIKGGHINTSNSCIDVVYHKGKTHLIEGPRYNVDTTHGSGCVFSSAITALLAKNKPVLEAIKEAKDVVTKAIVNGYKIGSGVGLTNPTSILHLDAEKYRVFENMKKALEMLEESSYVPLLVPEVQMNLVMALPEPYAKTIDDVMGVRGRIVNLGTKVKAAGPIEFGASKHLAKAVLTVMKYDPNIRAAINIKYDPEIIEICNKLGFTTSFYDRKEEPLEIKAIEGATIPWGIEVAIKKMNGKVPDIIYHFGDWGKEPMITVFGKDAIDVVNKVLKIAEEYAKKKRLSITGR